MPSSQGTSAPPSMRSSPRPWVLLWTGIRGLSIMSLIHTSNQVGNDRPAQDAARSLYVADYGSNRVRKIDLTRDPIHLGSGGGGSLPSLSSSAGSSDNLGSPDFAASTCRLGRWICGHISSGNRECRPDRPLVSTNYPVCRHSGDGRGEWLQWLLRRRRPCS